MNRKLIIAAILCAVIAIGSIVYLTIARSVSDGSNAPPVNAAAKAEGDGPTPFMIAQRKATADLPALRRDARARPSDVGVLARLGNAEMQSGAFPAAIAAYRSALAIDPGQSGLWSTLGEAYLQVGKNDGSKMPPEARSAFGKALALDKNDLRAHFYLALEQDFSGHHDEAIGEWVAMLSVVPRGSQPDIAIRAAIESSVKRNIGLLRKKLDAAMRAQAQIPAAAGG